MSTPAGTPGFVSPGEVPTGRHLGVIVRHRPTLAGFASWFPNVAHLGVIARWLWWLTAGWWATAGAAAVMMAWIIGSNWQLAGIVWAASIVVSCIPAPLAKRVSPGVTELAAWAPRFLNIGLIVVAGVRVGLARTVAAVLLLVLLSAVDRAAGKLFPWYDLWRIYCQFRRRLPIVWTILAGKTGDVQGAGIGSENVLTRGLNDRPLLDHPAMSLWCKLDVERCRIRGRMFAPPGRELKRLEAVREELAAADTFIHEIRLDPLAGASDSWVDVTIQARKP